MLPIFSESCKRQRLYNIAINRSPYLTSRGIRRGNPAVSLLAGIDRYNLAAMSKGLAPCVSVKLLFKTDSWQTTKIDTGELERNRNLF